jgi:tryptophan halogenase
MKVVVVGGGTAGWLTALYAKKFIPHSTITLIESKDIGILGAGEGTTPQFIDALRNLNIPVEDIIKHARGTIKSGIKFTGWGEKDYFHPFREVFHNNTRPYPVYRAILNDETLDQYTLASATSAENKVCFIPTPDQDYDVHETYLSRFKSQGGFSLHFDAQQLAILLKNIGVERGILTVDNIVTEVKKDTSDYITSLCFKDGTEIEADFIFDCTGFARSIIGKHYNAEWESYFDTIPNDRALPFFIKNDSQQIPPYTESIAMDNGWVWKIPVQGRFGCGYVFSSKYTTENDVIQEIRNKFGDVEFPRKSFEFKAGCFKTQWVKNCMSIGLASGFIEPLEATSLWGVVESLRIIGKHLPGILNRNEKYIELFNDDMYRFNKEIVSFIYLHYVTKKDKTVYWSKFRQNNTPPAGYLEFEKRYIGSFMTTQGYEGSFRLFSISSLLSVGVGIDFFDRDMVREQMDCLGKLQYNLKAAELLEQDQQDLKTLLDKTIDHYTFLEIIKNES